MLTAIHVTGIGLTVFRFRYRAKTQRLWWDDWIALLAMLVDCVYITILWFDYVQQGVRTDAAVGGLPPYNDI